MNSLAQLKDDSRNQVGARERAKPEPDPSEVLVFIFPNSHLSYSFEGQGKRRFALRFFGPLAVVWSVGIEGND